MSRLIRGIRTSISIKLMVVSELVLIVTIVAMLWIALPRMEKQIIGDLQLRLRGIASTAALQIDGDLHKQIRKPEDASSPAFVTLRQVLRRIRDANKLEDRQIYTFYVEPGDARNVRFAVMPNEQPFVGNAYDLRPLMLPVLTDGKPQVTELYHDKYGSWISAYAPIFDSRGAVVGLLEVDELADNYFNSYWKMAEYTLGLAVVILAVAALLGWVIVNELVRKPMRAVHDGMQALRRSEFNHRVTLNTGDEFQRLGDTFNRLARELNAARSVQASFAPKNIPSRNGWQIIAASEPCEATAGDYVDAFELPGNRIGVVVADVAGHGLAPALLMSACRSALRAMSALDLPPSKIVDRLDAMLMGDLTDGRFITLIFGVLESDGRFTYCNAGHGPALCIRSDRVAALAPPRASVLAPHRPPVGIGWQNEEEDGETTILLSPGERLLLASDGVTEAWSEADEQFGEDRLIAAVKDCSVAAQQVVQSLLKAIVNHRGAREQSDDITVLCIDRVNGAPAVPSN